MPYDEVSYQNVEDKILGEKNTIRKNLEKIILQ